jgi:putative phosphonate metabolism protein
MTPYPRYAIYHVPAETSALYRFGSELIGFDAFSGANLPFPAEATDAASDWQNLTADPRKYGFHATLKAPLTLASGKTESELIEAFASFAHTPRDVPNISPAINAISGFIAMVPAERSIELEILAQQCVEAFDHFRAPLTPADRARRNPAALTPRQVEQLDRWGYPYVNEDFRFHMTLTGRLPEARRPAILEMLRNRFAALDLKRLKIDRIALLRQDDAAARFRIIRHEALTTR